jgi:hypothetical protein
MGGELMALRIRATSPVYCGKCGKRRGLMHTCIVRRPSGRTRLKKPKVMLVSCSSCGQPYVNPLTHVCRGRPPGDFKRRKAAAERAARRRKAAEQREQRRAEAARRRAQGGPQKRPGHNYASCRDRDCNRALCRAYREGIERGFESAREVANR